MKTFEIRQYKEGDEKELVALYERCYRKNNGYIPRNASQWRATFIDHPHIGPTRVLVVGSDKLLGYIAFASDQHPLFPEDSGYAAVYEFSLQKGNTGIKAGMKLLESCLERCRQEGLMRLKIILPCKSKETETVLKKSGFLSTVNPLTLGITALDMESCLRRRFEECRVTEKKWKKLRFELSQDFSDKVVTLGNNGLLEIDLRENCNLSPVFIKSGFVTFTDMFLGGESVLGHFTSGKLKISPKNKTISTILLLQKIALKGKWSLPYIDWR